MHPIAVAGGLHGLAERDPRRGHHVQLGGQGRPADRPRVAAKPAPAQMPPLAGELHRPRN